MDGLHDLGGVEGLGAVLVEGGEPVFHAEWERRTFGLNFSAMPGGVDRFRHAIERMGIEYLTTTYYEHWLAAIEVLAVETGTVSAEELEAARAAARRGEPVPVVESPERAAGLVAAVRTPSGPPHDAAPARFAVGDRVRVRRGPFGRHTRCPRYVRGATGVVDAVRGRFRLPDAAVDGREELEPVYGVRFDAAELWGEGAHAVHLDLWEPYLDPGPAPGGRHG